jgi:DNA-binding response OmpR family regulator
MENKPKILIIEDNSDTLLFLKNILEKNYEVISAENAILGIEYARNKLPDVILLDIMLPMLSGLEACKAIRQDPVTRDIPIIFLSAKGEKKDITEGLELGGDDYLPKPFDYKELVARIQARLRESGRRKSPSTLKLRFGEVEIDFDTRSLTVGSKKANLTVTEFDILRLLTAKSGEVISRDEILKNVWQKHSKGVNGRTIDVHIRSIRKKAPELSRYITSIYGVGYKFEP